MQAELLVMVKAWDETFSQNVYQRYSYSYQEFVWGAKFTQAFTVDRDGSLELEVGRVSDHNLITTL